MNEEGLTDKEYLELLEKQLGYDETTPLLGVVFALVLSGMILAIVFGGYCIVTGKSLEARYSEVVR